MTSEDPLRSDQAQQRAKAYELAELDRDFILDDSMRWARLQLEHAKIKKNLRAWGVRPTIVLFGGHKIHPDGPTHHRAWYQQTRAFAVSPRKGAAQLLRTAPCATIWLRPAAGPDWWRQRIAVLRMPGTIYWIWYRARRGAATQCLFTPELTFRFQYFAIRKLHLAMRASALVVFPGGFGTLDEMFEILTLKQTGKTPPIPIMLFDESYWRSIVNFERLAREGMSAEDELSLFEFTIDQRDAWDRLERRVLLRCETWRQG